MKIKPVGHPVAPGYPDKYAEESRQALATAHPKRWIAAPVAAGLAATVAFGLSGCDRFVVMGDLAIPTEPAIGSGVPYGTEYFAAIAAAIPLFEFGEGTGSIGCLSVAAPVFLSEDEAFAILSAEFAEAGMMLRRNSKTRQAALPVTDLSPIRNPGEGRGETKDGSLTPDGSLDGLPVEFVSAADVEAWERDTDLASSVTTYPVKRAAQTLAENNPGLVVFYDPLPTVYHDERYEKLVEGRGWFKNEAEARDESEQQLRAQAAAFLQWLQTEGEPS